MTREEPAHSLHGASGFARLMACPGSFQQTKMSGEKKPSSYAEEGTAAHWVGEEVLLGRVAEPHDLVGAKAPNGIEVTEEMADAVAQYTAECIRIRNTGGRVWIEARVNLDFVLDTMGLTPGKDASLFGTADFVCYSKPQNTLYLRDYKHGKGVPVHVGTPEEPNVQLAYYALGAWDLVSKVSPLNPETIVDIGIVQPRAGGDPVQTIQLTAKQLLEFGYDIADTVFKTLEDDPELVTGEHCRFCAALWRCPKVMEQAQETARAEFEQVRSEPAATPEGIAMMRTDEELAEVLDFAEFVDAWVKAVRAEASYRLDQGRDIPGFKLVPKRATRSWDDENAVADWLEQNLLADWGMTAPAPKPLSVAQMEKMAKREGQDISDLLANHVIKASSGSTLARASDPRADVSGARSPHKEFDPTPNP